MTHAIRLMKIRVGDDVMTYCGRCKAERTHIIAAMNSDTVPAEVICRTCNTKHRFRRPADAPKETGASRARAAGGESASKRRVKPAAEPAPATGRPYAPAGTFAEGEWIEHRLYGVGQVKTVRAGKIDVSFEGTLRTLVHTG